MRRPIQWSGLALTIALLGSFGAGPLAAPISGGSTQLGDTPSYKILGQFPVMHTGRVKPLDTVAREEIKEIYTREAIKLFDDKGEVIATWLPVAAFFDFPARPKFWDAQPIIAVEYLPLKRMILAGAIQEDLDAIASKKGIATSLADRLQSLAKAEEVTTEDLKEVLRTGDLSPEDRKDITALAAKVGEGQKWLAPTDLEESEVTVDDRKMPFLAWVDAISRRGRDSGSMSDEKPKLSELERKAFEVGMKLAKYRAIRDRETFSVIPLMALPHPVNEAFLTYSAEAFKKASDGGGRGLEPLEREAAITLDKYLNDQPKKDRALPGTDKEFDAKYLGWLKEKSAWVPLGLVREVPVDELARAGYPSAKVQEFRSAFNAVEEDELANPGHATVGPAARLIDAARDLGLTVNSTLYPTPEAMAREANFNAFAPFYKAPVAYGLGVVLLIASLVTSGLGVGLRSPLMAKTSKLAYLGGIAGFAAGIGLECYGFLQRILISGWAPVTNLYETVIWVALITSVIGLVLEAVYRKTYSALAASGMALFATLLAANVPMLDPNISGLQPVLRSNLWLSIHVLTIVSSYGAFALGLALGLVATTDYLTATYRRTASFGEILALLGPGLPLLGLGVATSYASYGHFGASNLIQEYGFYPGMIVGSIGGVLTATSLFALVGELVNRALFHDPAASVDPLLSPTGQEQVVSTTPITPGDDARTRSMRATAARIKPMSNFIYRSMQVGVLLVALGTFLGGWWADVSWGRFWGWDPKEVWALITLLVYLIPLHGRFAGWVNTFGLVMSSVVCFLSVLMAWYGVNHVIGIGLHAYGMTEGGGQGVVGIATLTVLSYAAASAWRRHLSNIKLVASA